MDPNTFTPHWPNQKIVSSLSNRRLSIISRVSMQFTPYIYLLLATATICLAIGGYAWRYRDIKVESLITFIMMTAITAWLVAAALGYATTNPADKMTWAQIEYLGVVSVPLMVFIFSVYYSGLRRVLTSRNLVVITLIPAFTLIFTWLNGNLGLIWSSYVPYQENGLMLSNKTYGLWFWVYWVYSYLLLLAATILIVRTALRSNKIFKQQAIVLIFGILAPWVGNALYVLHLSPLKNLDLTPLLFAITGTMLSLGIMRWRLFDIKPTAHLAVIESLVDGLILTNKHNRIIDINPAACRIFQTSSFKAVGQSDSQIIPAELLTSKLPASNNRVRTELILPQLGGERYFELTSTPFYDKLGELMGRIIIAHDITELKQMHEKLIMTERKYLEKKINESEGKYRALFNSANDAIIISDTETGLIIDANKEAEVLLAQPHNEIIGSPRSSIYPNGKVYDDNFNRLKIDGKMIDVFCK